MALSGERRLHMHPHAISWKDGWLLMSVLHPEVLCIRRERKDMQSVKVIAYVEKQSHDHYGHVD
jgi:hypothetical protein